MRQYQLSVADSEIENQFAYISRPEKIRSLVSDFIIALIFFSIQFVNISEKYIVN